MGSPALSSAVRQRRTPRVKSARAFHRVTQAMWRQVNAPNAIWVDGLVQLRARMSHPRPGDLVVDAATLVSGYDSSRIGTVVARRRDTWLLEPWGREGEQVSFENVQFLAVPGHGSDWPS